MVICTSFIKFFNISLYSNYSSLELQSNGPHWKWSLFLHNTNDLPDAYTIHPNIKALWNPGSALSYDFTLRTRHFSKDSTKYSPCSNYQPKACTDVYLQQKIAEDYNCQIPIFFSGKHMENKAILSLPTCNNSVTLEMVTFSDKSLKCQRSVPCEHTDYTLEGAYWSYQGNPKLTLTQIQEHFESYQSSITVDTQTLIGQVGGILGITLGWSGMSLIEWIDLFWQPALLLF